MRLSKETQYALRGLTELAQQPEGTIVDIGRLAASAHLPRAFLAQIFRRLALHGLLRAYRGRSRGFSLASPAAQVSVRSVVEAIEGPRFFERCVFFSDECSERRPCQLHAMWADIRPSLMAQIDSTSVQNLAAAKSELDDLAKGERADMEAG
jgi:Rrf2 family protein